MNADGKLSLTTFLAELRKKRPKFRDESLAPTVERDLLWCLVRGTLNESDRRAVLLLVHSFQSWDEAHTEILVQHYHETRRSSADLTTTKNRAVDDTPQAS